MTGFSHERLVVYRTALQFLDFANRLLDRLPRGNGSVADQLRRAARSVVLNIAEGAGEFSRSEKHRFYRMARRSATECAALIDVLGLSDLVDAAEAAEAKNLLDRIVAMLTRMQRPREKAGADVDADADVRPGPHP